MLFRSNDSMDMGVSKLRELVKDREAWRAAVHGITKNRTRLIAPVYGLYITTFSSPSFSLSSQRTVTNLRSEKEGK